MSDYLWQRYWHSTADIPRTNNGFLYVLGEYERICLPFEQFSTTGCLILLGEPGIGKSNEIARIAKLESPNDRSKLYVNLNSIGSEASLMRKVFDSKKVDDWKAGNYDFFLYLDSLDEALLNINTLSGLLADEISTLPANRLYIRVACRAGEWASFSKLNNQLHSQWESNNHRIIQLAPLTIQDVWNAADQEKLDADRFVQEILEKSIQPLAAKPMTLKLLLNLFKSATGLPSTQFAVYERGCLKLCEEDYEERPARKEKDELSNEQRFRIAARIAALMIFSNKSSIWTGGDTGEQAPTDVTINELSNFDEFNRDTSLFHVSEKSVREVLDKGLFSSDGTKRVRFFHQTIAEFLATWYLDYREIPNDDVIELLGEKNPHPQLYETSAWIAGRREGIFAHIAKVAPLVLLRSDTLAADDTSRYELTEKLLAIFDRQEALDRETRNEYKKLSHPKLAEQLRPYMCEKNKGWLVRRVAIDIAESCEVGELQNDLLTIVLDTNDSHGTRVNAAYALKRVGDEQTKAQLKPLVWGSYGDDENLELKGVAMSALWKTHLSTPELFSAYKEPTPNFLGSYKSFFYSIVPKFDSEDFAVALEWLRSKSINDEHFTYETERLAADIVSGALNYLDDLTVFDNFVAALLPYLRTYRHGFSGGHNQISYESPQLKEKRRRVLLALIPFLNTREDWIELSMSPFFNFNIKDTEWIVEAWIESTNAIVKERLGDLLRGWVASSQSFYSQGADPEFLGEISKGMSLDDGLNQLIQPFFKEINLGSKEEIEAKRAYEKYLELHSKLRLPDRDETILNPPPKERVLDCLKRFENGEIDFWWVLNREMTIRPNSLVYGDPFESDLEKLPGWLEADKDTKDRIVRAAKKYILTGNPKNESWLGKNIIQFSAFAGYRAIKLLIKHDSEFIYTLGIENWNRWTPIIYFYPIYNSSQNGDVREHQHLVKSAYNLNPDLFETLVAYEIEKAAAEGNGFLSFDKLELCWDPRLREIWRKYAITREIPSQVRLRIFEQLFELEDDETTNHACSIIGRSIPNDASNRELYSGLMQLCVRFGIREAWPRVWAVLNNEVEFGKSMLESGVYRFGGALFDHLSDEELGELYAWLAKNYPYSEDPDFSGESMAHLVGPREEMGRWRNLALDRLKDRGTDDSVRAIEKILGDFPEMEWLKFTLIDAKHSRQVKNWKPSSLPQLLDILRIRKGPKSVLTVLFFAANPRDQQALSIDEEIRAIQDKVRVSEFRESIDIQSRWAVRPSDILQALNEVKPYIVHFSGHGTNNDEIVFQDDSGDSVIVSKDAIIQTIISAAENVKVVIFNTCFSSNQAESITRHIDAAVGMNDSISDEAARVFASQFYSSLGFGQSVKTAFEQGKAAMMLENIPEEDKPQLYVKPGLDAKKIVLIRE